jgi:transcriptional regulator with XRE-family HTH domain
MTSATRLTGDSLRLLRLARRIKLSELARAYGVSRARITAIESTARPTSHAVHRYMQALAELEEAE